MYRRVAAHEDGEEGVEKYKGSAKTSIGDDCEQCTERVDLWHHNEKQHGCDGTGKGKYEEETLPVYSMIRSSTHGNDYESLYEHTDGKCVHGEAGSVDFGAQEVYDTLC